MRKPPPAREVPGVPEIWDTYETYREPEPEVAPTPALQVEPQAVEIELEP